jgi:peptidoglycan/LPS O-acetylase OafA/YrhL
MRYKALDSWRGICALFVVLYHAKGEGLLGQSSFIGGAFLFVDFFFVLSGFVMAEAYAARIEDGRGFREFLVRRFGRVWPLHAAMLLAFLGLELTKLALVKATGLQLTNAPFSASMSPDGFLPSLLLVHAMGLRDALTWNGPSWSIGAEFWTYAVFGLVIWRFRERKILVSTLLSLGAAVVLLVYSPRLMDVTYDLGFVRCLYGFFLGVVGHRISTQWRASHGPFGTLAEAASACLAFAFVALAHDSRLAFVSPIVFVLVIFVFAWSDGSLARALQTRPFLNLGLWSYSIYMTHLFLIGAVSMLGKLLTKVVGASPAAAQWSERIASPGASDVGMVAFTLLVVAISSMTYRFIELPGQALVNRWVKARR